MPMIKVRSNVIWGVFQPWPIGSSAESHSGHETPARADRGRLLRRRCPPASSWSNSAFGRSGFSAANPMELPQHIPAIGCQCRGPTRRADRRKRDVQRDHVGDTIHISAEPARDLERPALHRRIFRHWRT